jgi:hypothetical protein
MTIQLTEHSLAENKITKRIAKTFSSGNSIGVRLPYLMAAEHRLDQPATYVLCENTEKDILIKRLPEEVL